MNEILALVAVVIAGSSGLVAACFRPKAGDRVFTSLLVIGASCGLFSAFRAFWRPARAPWSLPWSVPGGELQVQVDALSAMFLVQIFLIGALGAIYGRGYWPASERPENAAKLRIFYGLTVAGMALLVVARNAVLFLVGWEIMALAAFFAVTTEDDVPAVRESGFVYLISTRIGTLCVFAMFAVLYSLTGSFSLSAVGLDGRSPAATAVFLLALAGFGIKAGLMPLHVWLPGAHANAPSHVSALMSGVLIKMGIYGLLRVSSFFDPLPPWWGVSTFGLGVVSSVLGVAFAIGQHDLKRLLAYHSVENIGIIAIGLGVALLGRATEQPSLIALGLAGALLHVWNHGLFKALLFMSAGSVIHATHTREIDRLGGLAKRLPKTSLAFLVGAIAICGLPPLNGFVSEFFVYLGMLRAGSASADSVALLIVLGVPFLAFAGGLAALCFAKVFGVVFLGEPRGAEGQHAAESPRAMLAPMAVLAAFCVLIGALPPLVAPVLDRATAVWLGGAPHESLHALAPLRPLSWVNGLLLAVLLIAGAFATRAARSSAAPRGPTWDCGYAAPSARMQYTASSIADWVVGIFRVLLRPSVHAPRLAEPFPRPSRFESHVPEVVLDLGILPIGRRLARGAAWFHWIQHGNVHLYVLYVAAALIVMLFVWR